MNPIVHSVEVRKAVVDSLSAPSEDIARHVLSLAGANPSQIEKSISTGTGLVAYDLQAPARNLVKVQNGQAAAQALNALDVAGVSTVKTILQSLVSTGVTSVLGKLAPIALAAL